MTRHIAMRLESLLSIFHESTRSWLATALQDLWEYAAYKETCAYLILSQSVAECWLPDFKERNKETSY